MPILDQFGNPFPGTPEILEVATIAGGRDVTRGFVDPMQPLQPQDTVLRARGGNYDTYREVLRDDQVAAVFAQRRLAVTSREWEVRPGGEKRQDKAAAKFLEEQFKRVKWDAVTDKMLYGVFYGHAVAECLYGREGSFVILDGIRVRDRRRFAYDGAMRLRLLTAASPLGEELPPAKFWTFATGADHDDEPYGLGLAHWLYWPVFFKRNGIKFWLVFLEKFGMPTGKGTYPASASPEDRKRLLAALAAIQTDAGIIIPEGMQVELIEAARSGSVDYTALVNKMDAAIAKVVLGQTLTTEAVGGQYKADVQMSVRQDLVKADADVICQSFNLTVARWLTEWNFPGAAVPEVWRVIEEPEDLDKAATRDKTLAEIGFRPTLARIQETYGPDYEDTGPPAPAPLPNGGSGRSPVGGGSAPEFAEAPGAQALTNRADQDELVAAAEALSGDWERLMRGRFEDLLAMLEQTGDLALFRERLSELLEAEPSAAMVEALARAGFAAQIIGRGKSA